MNNQEIEVWIETIETLGRHWGKWWYHGGYFTKEKYHMIWIDMGFGTQTVGEKPRQKAEREVETWDTPKIEDQTLSINSGLVVDLPFGTIECGCLNIRVGFISTGTWCNMMMKHRFWSAPYPHPLNFKLLGGFVRCFVGLEHENYPKRTIGSWSHAFPPTDLNCDFGVNGEKVAIFNPTLGIINDVFPVTGVWRTQ